jgi:hypothetical protein
MLQVVEKGDSLLWCPFAKRFKPNPFLRCVKNEIDGELVYSEPTLRHIAKGLIEGLVYLHNIAS